MTEVVRATGERFTTAGDFARFVEENIRMEMEMARRRSIERAYEKARLWNVV